MQKTLFDGTWFVFARCPRCEMDHAFPETLYSTGMLRRDSFSIFCPNGHAWHYVEGETAEAKLCRERDRLKPKLAEVVDERDAAIRHADANALKARRLETRSKNGLCPCCNRSFANLRCHVATKHPEFRATN
ncbi:hypothetical protein [Sinorhizobium fredii]|uniref:hypothetical protein n=1 Tax=Rhizobium fredii TaxID=380 RepID=UPI0004B33326|nr:hypothetical protein [Sinorhizobium fredii]